jgi:RNA recognition motif-containing protein
LNSKILKFLKLGFGFAIFKDEKSIDSVMEMKNNHNINGKWVKKKIKNN